MLGIKPSALQRPGDTTHPAGLPAAGLPGRARVEGTAGGQRLHGEHPLQGTLRGTWPCPARLSHLPGSAGAGAGPCPGREALRAPTIGFCVVSTRAPAPALGAGQGHHMEGTCPSLCLGVRPVWMGCSPWHGEETLSHAGWGHASPSPLQPGNVTTRYRDDGHKVGVSVSLFPATPAPGAARPETPRVLQGSPSGAQPGGKTSPRLGALQQSRE